MGGHSQVGVNKLVTFGVQQLVEPISEGRGIKVHERGERGNQIAKKMA